MIEMKKGSIENKEERFVIDFFELAFLTEACLPPSTIARHTFFMNTINLYYHQMSWEQRNHFFNWIGKKLNTEHEESRLFIARFNPENQYLVKTNFEGKEQDVEAFMYEDKYMISSSRRVDDKYITGVDKLII